MKKSYLILAAIASVALASCSNEEYLGEFEGAIHGEKAISFNSEYGRVTRAETGAAAAELLNKEFVFAGTKQTGSTAPTSFVFDQYIAKYVTNTAGTTESNMNNWEYVSYTPATTTSLGTGATQSIKYWDYSADQYDFVAYSFGKGAEGTSTTYATATAIKSGDKSYTLKGSAEELAACYITDIVNVPKANFGQPVTFSFRSLGTKIRLAFYETVPGYSVKDVMFYNIAKADESSSPASPTGTPTWFVKTNDTFKGLPSGNGAMAVSFTDGKAHVTFTPSTEGTNVSATQSFGALADYPTTFEGILSSGSFLGRASNSATYAGGIDATTSAGKYYTVLPYEAGANLQLRIKYTLVSTDGSGEEITVDNATAVVPAEFAQWQPNFAYTYIFKISDMTNGSTGVDENDQIVTGLTPITLDAVVVNSEDNGIQETITTVSEPSITTYSEGKVVTVNNEYNVGAPIYVVVNNGTSNVTLTVGTNAKLYTATIEDGANQTISESSVENAIAQNTDGYDKGEVLESGASLDGYYTYNTTTGIYTACEANGTADGTTKYYKPAAYSVKDANGKKLVINNATGLEAVSKINAADSPTGKEISVPGAKFTPSAAGNYVFQYEKKAAVNYTQPEVNTLNAALDGAISTDNTAYEFISYNNSEQTTTYGTGKVKLISTTDGWTTVLVTSNTPTDPNAANFVGQQFKVNATSITDNTVYQLYSIGGDPLPIYVTVTTSTFSEDEVNTYNATLPGAKSTTDIKTPAEYQYKVIIVQ